MKTYKRYQDQYSEIKSLLKSIDEKSKKFANSKHQSEWFGELGHIISELKELNEVVL